MLHPFVFLPLLLIPAHGDQDVNHNRIASCFTHLSFCRVHRSRYAAIGRIAQTVLREAIGVGYSFSWMLFINDILAVKSGSQIRKDDDDDDEEE